MKREIIPIEFISKGILFSTPPLTLFRQEPNPGMAEPNGYEFISPEIVLKYI
jgi:hypothetical protein